MELFALPNDIKLNIASCDESVWQFFALYDESFEGPAIIYARLFTMEISKSTYLFSKLNSVDDRPARCFDYMGGLEFGWYYGGKLHRMGNPAIVLRSCKDWIVPGNIRETYYCFGIIVTDTHKIKRPKSIGLARDTLMRLAEKIRIMRKTAGAIETEIDNLSEELASTSTCNPLYFELKAQYPRRTNNLGLRLVRMRSTIEKERNKLSRMYFAFNNSG